MVNQASAGCGRGRAARSRTSNTASLQARRPRLRRSARLDACARRRAGQVHAAARHPSRRRSTWGTGTTPATASSSTSAAAFIMDDAEQLLPTCGSSAASSIGRPAARRLAGDPAGVAGHRGDPAAARRRSSTCSRILPAKTRTSTRGSAREFGRVLKEGIGEDPVNRERIAGLLAVRVDDSDTADETVMLADDVGRN